jgi:Zn-dependent protease
VNGVALGRWFGVPVRLDGTALLLLGLLLLGSARGGPASFAGGVAYAVVVFGSVLVHELGHAVAGRTRGLGVVEIVLHGFGGLTRFARAPTPAEGVGVTLAGPAAGLALGLVLVPVRVFVGAVGVLDAAIAFNVGWSLFNLVPMFPLDGGQVLFHVLARRGPAAGAWRTTGRVGLALAVVVAIVGGLRGDTFLVLVAVFSAVQCWRVARA